MKWWQQIIVTVASGLINLLSKKLEKKESDSFNSK